MILTPLNTQSSLRSRATLPPMGPGPAKTREPEQGRARQSRAEQGRAGQSKADHSRADHSRAEQGRAGDRIWHHLCALLLLCAFLLSSFVHFLCIFVHFVHTMHTHMHTHRHAQFYMHFYMHFLALFGCFPRLKNGLKRKPDLQRTGSAFQNCKV